MLWDAVSFQSFFPSPQILSGFFDCYSLPWLFLASLAVPCFIGCSLLHWYFLLLWLFLTSLAVPCFLDCSFFHWLFLASLTLSLLHWLFLASLTVPHVLDCSSHPWLFLASLTVPCFIDCSSLSWLFPLHWLTFACLLAFRFLSCFLLPWLFHTVPRLLDCSTLPRHGCSWLPWLIIASCNLFLLDSLTEKCTPISGDLRPRQ
jgi:hypothetical protein